MTFFSSLSSKISPLCKSIINEYATKLHIEGPSYNTVQQQHSGGVLPVFTSSLVFNGTSYTGDHAKTKKEAEQSAAQAAILSIMGILLCMRYYIFSIYFI